MTLFTSFDAGSPALCPKSNKKTVWNDEFKMFKYNIVCPRRNLQRVSKNKQRTEQFCQCTNVREKEITKTVTLSKMVVRGSASRVKENQGVNYLDDTGA